MKKLLLLATFLVTLTTFANFTPTPKVLIWDKPITENSKVIDPALTYCAPWIQNPQGFRIDYTIEGEAERDMKITMHVRTYKRNLNLTWSWVWLQYNIIIPAHDGNGGGVYFNVNPAWQYQGSYNFNGDLIIDSDQYYVSYYGPL
jgi:hypothetical protein